MRPRNTDISRHGAGIDPRPHRHADAYLALVLEGSYLESSIDGLWRCEPGDVIVHPPFHFHSNTFHRKTAVLNFHVDHSEAVKHGIFDYTVVRPRHPDILLSNEPDAAEILACLGTAQPVERQELPGWIGAMARDLVRDPTQRVADLAERLCVSAEHAARQFGAHYSMRPTAFRAECRFRNAFSLLRRTNLSLCDIAGDCGYSDQSHFSRNALAVTGWTPRTLRDFFHTDQEYSRPDPVSA